MNQQIDRIEAQRDLRKLTLLNVAQGQEETTQYRERLIGEVGTVVIENKRDAAAINSLKTLQYAN